MATSKAYYTAPGVQIEKIFRNVSNTSTEIPRGVCIIGAADEYKQVYAEAIIRGYVKGEGLTVSPTSPYTATLSRNSNQDKGDTVIYWEDENGNPHNLAEVDWDFSSANEIFIKDNIYRPGRLYKISYQSTQEDTTDELTQNDVFEVITVGDQPGQSNYKLGTDVYLKTVIQEVEAGDTNVGTGLIQINPTSYYTKFEERTYTITITATGAALSDVRFSWWGNSPASGSDINVVGAASISLEDGISIQMTSTGSAYHVNDTYTFIVDSLDIISWDKTTSVSETVPQLNIFHDVYGTVTGNMGNWYVSLENKADSLTAVVDLTSSASILVDCSIITGTNYIDVGTHHPVDGIQFNYVHSGKEPKVGAIYYVSYKHSRADADYFAPKLAFSLDELVADVGGVSAGNQLSMAAQIAFENNAPFVWYIQIKDRDGDGVYSFMDYIAGIEASEEKEGITDVICLNTTQQVRARLKESVNALSAPTGQKERLGWFGMPIGTPIGDVDEPGSYVYTGKKVLREAGDAPGRGRYLLLAPDRIKKTFLLKDGSEEQFILDSNYMGVACASVLASFASPAEALLRKQVVGFDEIGEYTTKEREYLAAAGVMVIQNKDGVHVIFDDTTTDTTSDDVMIPSAMVQQDYVTKTLRQYLDARIIGYVPRNVGEGIALIRSAIALKLRQCVCAEVIAPYGDDEDRDINPQGDIYVERDPISKTTYNFKYWFNIRYPIKRLFGQYTVDQTFQPQK
jgi:hypothetical protein